MLTHAPPQANFHASLGFSNRWGVEEDQKQTIQTLENEHLQLKETIKELQARQGRRDSDETKMERGRNQILTIYTSIKSTLCTASFPYVQNKILVKTIYEIIIWEIFHAFSRQWIEIQLYEISQEDREDASPGGGAAKLRTTWPSWVGWKSGDCSRRTGFSTGISWISWKTWWIRPGRTGWEVEK